MFLSLTLLSAFIVSVRPACCNSHYDHYETFEDDVLFEWNLEDYINPPSFPQVDWDKKIAGGLFKIQCKYYYYAFKGYIRFPAKIKARYDTTLEPWEENAVEMAVEPYNGDGYEFEVTIGSNISAKMEIDSIPGTFKAGDFCTGFNWEGDFTPPLVGQAPEYSSDDGISGSIGLYKLLSLDIGVAFRVKFSDGKVVGDYSEEDPYAEPYDIGPSGVVLTNSTLSEQFGINDTDAYTSNDAYADFKVHNLKYKIKCTIEIAPTIGFTVLTCGWEWTVPVWTAITDFTFPIDINPDESDDDGEPKYQMTRLTSGLPDPPAAEFDPPIFSIGPMPRMMSPVQPGESKLIDIPIRQIHTTVNPPPSYDPSTTIDIYYENGTKITVSVSQTDFNNGKVTMTIWMPVTADVGYHSLEFVLNWPSFPSEWKFELGTVPESSTARLVFVFILPDLNVELCNLEISEIYPDRLIADVTNIGDLPSSPSTANFWLYEGIPAESTDPADLCCPEESTLLYSEGPFVLPNDNTQRVVYLYPVADWISKIVTLIVEVQSGIEKTKVNNYAWTTVFLMNYTDDIAIVTVYRDPSTVTVGQRVNIYVTLKNEGTMVQEGFPKRVR